MVIPVLTDPVENSRRQKEHEAPKVKTRRVEPEEASELALSAASALAHQSMPRPLLSLRHDT